MATLTIAFNRLFARGAGLAEDAARELDQGSRLRPFANEDIYFYIKRIDNSDVVRQADPAAGEACWRMIGSVVAAAVLMVGVLMPGAYGLLAGYKVQSLQQEGLRLEAERAELQLQEAALVSPAHMEELARMQRFIDPAPERIVYLEGRSDSELASVASSLPE